MLNAGIERVGAADRVRSELHACTARGLATEVPETPFVMYGVAETVVSRGAEVLAEVVPPYFNRTYRALLVASAHA